MLVKGKRPRELHWYHAGPMLFGDWGTSRLYVLGLAFFYTQHASLWFMLAMSVLLVAVGWAYQVICRLYPDGGGVYSSARHRSQTLAVIGALALVRRLRGDGRAVGARRVSLRRTCPAASVGRRQHRADRRAQLLRPDEGRHARAGRGLADDRCSAS